ncbi:MAG: DUF1573 domain-containing protein [Deltaproteobacteria bacterium]|nr:DUF1573 domain-containing protein [Deltaproteobacteria bacterium]
MRRSPMTGLLMLGLLTFIGAGLIGCPEQPTGQADSSSVNADPGTDTTAAAPVITCAEAKHDFGTVPQGQEVKHVFTVKNTGKGVLKIIRAKGG